MMLASHNSWSYATPKKWWMKLLKHTARCQAVGIKTQYEKYGVKCFDLRVRFSKSGIFQVVHGCIVYNITRCQLAEDLKYLDSKKDVRIRLLLDVRRESQYTYNQIAEFRKYCKDVQSTYQNIRFWGGQNLYNHKCEYLFMYKPTCDEYYSSVRPPKIIDDWLPILYAKINNKSILEEGTKKHFLMIDFVNIR